MFCLICLCCCSTTLVHTKLPTPIACMKRAGFARHSWSFDSSKMFEKDCHDIWYTKCLIMCFLILAFIGPFPSCFHLINIYVLK